MGQATATQYIDKEDNHKRWVAQVNYRNEEVKTYHLESRESAALECEAWAKKMNWDLTDNDYP